MKVWILISIVAGLLLLAVPRVASAQAADTNDSGAESAQSEQDIQPDADTRRAYCLQHTGTRIRPPAGACSSRSGRVYTREDIERTGDVNLNDALRHLDPSLH